MGIILTSFAFAPICRHGERRCRDAGALRVLKDNDFSSRLCGGWNFGPVSAQLAMEFALNKLSKGAVMSVVTVRNCNLLRV